MIYDDWKEKINRKIFYLLLFFSFLGGCSQLNTPTLPENTANPDLYPCESLPEQRTEGKAFKGIELYSYSNNDDQWVFSVLVGTNRIKTYQEVIAEALNIDQLEVCFCTLAVGERVFWTNYLIGSAGDEYLLNPPESLISEVQNLALACEIELWPSIE